MSSNKVWLVCFRYKEHTVFQNVVFPEPVSRKQAIDKLAELEQKNHKAWIEHTQTGRILGMTTAEAKHRDLAPF